MTGAQSPSVPATANGNQLTVPITSQVGLGGVLVVGAGIPPNTMIGNIAFNGTFTQLVLTLSQSATVTGPTSVQFDTTNCFANNTLVQATVGANASNVMVNGVSVPTVTVTHGQSCTGFPNLGNGLPLAFNTSGVFPAGTTIANIAGNTITLTNSANPVPGLAAGTTTTSGRWALPHGPGSAAAPTCPIIPFSPRGGASTRPERWRRRYRQFAKNRLSTIP